jgi:leucyl-tRNA synthetase
MSKSKYNVVTPDAICKNTEQILAFVRNVLRPLEQAKPWNTGISGVLFLEKTVSFVF